LIYLFPYNLRFPGQYYQAETGLNQNYHRDYDPLVGRYIEPDPLLQPNTLLGRGLAFYVPLLVPTPTWLQLYTYVRSQPERDSDRVGLLPLWDFIHCLWLDHKMGQYNKECRGQCPNTMEGQVRFMQQYQSPSLSGALLHCTCSKAKAAGDGDLCADWMSTCMAAGFPDEGPE
jgi:RHS repeat-associated protein